MREDNRVACPHCNESLPGVQTIGGTTTLRYNGGYVTMERCTLPCRCGACLVVALGQVVESVPPPDKKRQ